jgi:ABC-type proline/glycine betaine transport system ATPase subunit
LGRHPEGLVNAAFGLEVSGVRRGERRARALEALETVGLRALADSYPEEIVSRPANEHVRSFFYGADVSTLFKARDIAEDIDWKTQLQTLDRTGAP